MNKKGTYLTLTDFQKMNCYSDIRERFLMMKHWEKEYSESASMISYIKNDLLLYPHTITILDLCSGSALTGVLLAYLTPIKHVICFDKFKRPSVNLENVHNFSFIERDVYDDSIYDVIDEHTVILGCHLCRDLSYRAIEIYQHSRAYKCVLMPCCHGKNDNKPLDGFRDAQLNGWLLEQLGQYDMWSSLRSTEWTYQLARTFDTEKSKVRITKASHCSSPKNNVIIAQKH